MRPASWLNRLVLAGGCALRETGRVGGPCALAIFAFSFQSHAEEKKESTRQGPAVTEAAPRSVTPVIQVHDPMLDPPAPPARIISGFAEATSLIRARSTDLRVALADVERAEAASRVALAAALPTLGASGNVTYQPLRTVLNPARAEFFPDHATTYGANAALSIPIFAPRAWHQMGTAAGSIDIAKLEVAEQKRVLGLAAAAALVNALTSERVSEINRVSLRAALERLEILRRRERLGGASGLDVVRVEQDASLARGAVVTGDESLWEAREALGLALGFAEPVSVSPNLDLDALARETSQACTFRDGIEWRTDLQAARAAKNNAERGIVDAQLAFSPTASINSTYSANVQQLSVVNAANLGQLATGSPVGTSYTTQLIQSWSIAAVLSWTLFDGGVRYGNLRDARAQVDQASARAESTLRSATVDVARAARGIRVSEEAYQVAVKSRDFARETERLSRVDFDLGRGSTLALVDAAQRLREAELQLALREFDLVQSKIRALLSLSVCNY